MPIPNNNPAGKGKGRRWGWAEASRLPWLSLPKRWPKNRIHTNQIKVCVPITGFPVTGGMRAVLANIALVTKDSWQFEYLTQRIGPEPAGFMISRFGASFMSPWQFPFVWLYALAGFRKLLSLMRRGADYQLILPQDGVFTAAFAGLAGKIMGVRVVCIDHGNLTLLKSQIYHVERLRALATKGWPRRLLERVLFVAYWPSLYMLAKIAARTVDYYMVPGVEGDGVETICAQLGIDRNRLMRFASMIDVNEYPVLSAEERAALRQHYALPSDALVIAIACRLSPEKGIDIALHALELAFAELSPEARTQVRIVIAGTGPLANHVRELISSKGLSQCCVMWGEIAPAKVKSLLGISDIFLYTSIRGACLSMAVLEAMAAGCAVVASTQPLSNQSMLAEGRGIAVPPGDSEKTAQALLRLLKEPHLCQRMGALARAYVAVEHSPAMFSQALLRACGSIAITEEARSEVESDVHEKPYEMEHAQ